MSWMPNKNTLLVNYYRYWINQYKAGSVRDVTFESYQLTLKQLEELVPNLKLVEVNHFTYQKLINDYAKNHEYTTVKGFHHHIKAAMLDALDENLISRDPTRHLVLKGLDPKPKKTKFLSLLELKLLLHQIHLGKEIDLDWLILLVSKTGLRVAEALGLTPEDFNFEEGMISVTKTWDYKSKTGGFQSTKNKSSIRTIALDPITCEQFKDALADCESHRPIFVPRGKRVFISTINNRLRKYCEAAGVSVISIHGLRHTHASLLIYDGVSISSVAKRLGHSSTITTQNTYLHVIKELQVKDDNKIMENMIRLA